MALNYFSNDNAGANASNGNCENKQQLDSGKSAVKQKNAECGAKPSLDCDKKFCSGL
jgi:hypothetical protein